MKVTGKLATEPEDKENHPIFQWAGGSVTHRIFWVLPKPLILHGHCAPRSASSYEILILCPMSHGGS